MLGLTEILKTLAEFWRNWCNYLEFFEDPWRKHPFLLQLVWRLLWLFSSCSDKVKKFLVSILFIPTRYTSVKREELRYPSSTMVAEVGGTLGLFLGVSFMTVWDESSGWGRTFDFSDPFYLMILSKKKRIEYQICISVSQKTTQIQASKCTFQRMMRNKILLTEL